MDQKTFKCLVVSDFNVANFAGLLSNDPQAPAIAAKTGPFGQVVQVLVDRAQDCWRDPAPDFLVAWTQPQNVAAAFKALIDGQPASLEDVLAQVDEYARLLASAAGAVRLAFVPTWVLPPYQRGLGMLDMKSPLGLAGTLLRMNLRLVEALEKVPNIYVLDAGRWFQAAGSAAFNPKAWYLGKIAYGNEVFKEAAKDVKIALRGIAGQARKLILLDLDDTLWGGIVGDLGWEELQLGGHDAAGEAFVDFQRGLKALKNRGVLLGIVSKNEQAVALEAIDRHPEMVLRRDDFSGWRIDWGDKAGNIADLVAELNLGLQSVVFIDDNPVERARVREALPEVLVPDWPEDRLLSRKALEELACFDVPTISQEDLERTGMYVAERKRAAVKGEVGSVEEWLASLGIRVSAAILNERNLARAAQLFNKTNQMNLSTRRLTESELTAWAAEPGHHLWVFRVADKFGDYGLTGLASLAVKGSQGRIVDFILSCRVMGRKVEETILHHLVQAARDLGLAEVVAEYLPTAKNKPCLSFFEASGFTRQSENDLFSWEADKEYPQPPQVEIASET